MKEFPWGYIIGAAVTVIGLLINQWRADRRDAERWNKEIDRDRLRWDRERTERLEQWQREDDARTDTWRREDDRRWFEERRMLYAQCVQVGRRFLEVARKSTIILINVSHDAQMKHWDEILNAQDQFEKAASEAEILAGDATSHQLAEVVASFNQVVNAVMFASSKDSDRINDAVGEAHEVFGRLVPLVRDDIGVVHDRLPNAQISSEVAPTKSPPQ
jgi:hypothetical protein